MEAPFDTDAMYEDIAKLMRRNMQLVQEVGRYKRLCDEMAELIKLGQAECALRAYKADDIIKWYNSLKKDPNGNSCE